MTADTGLPEFLSGLDPFLAHLAASLEGDTTGEKGDTFVTLATSIVPLFDEARPFGPLRPSEKKSHDKGVDLLNMDDSQSPRLYCQAKYRIPGVETIDGIVSKFENFETELSSTPDTLFPEDPQEPPSYGIVTTTDLRQILPKYRKSAHSSVRFFTKLETDRRIFFWDGPRLLRKFQEIWKRTYVIPMDISLRSQAGWVISGTVAIGIVTARTLTDLYEQHGDSMFFENIREYIGSESDVNGRIRDTVIREPEKLLERNNGVTFRAIATHRQPDDPNTLHLTSGAIVNGCQTTMSAVEATRELGEATTKFNTDCLLQVKVVSVEDAWAVASAANYQNTVHRIDLELAKWLRPQLVRRAAALEGISISGQGADGTPPAATVNDLLRTFYKHEIRHDQVRYLFLGVFGSLPNDLFANNYERIKQDVVNGVYAGGRRRDPGRLPVTLPHGGIQR